MKTLTIAIATAAISMGSVVWAGGSGPSQNDINRCGNNGLGNGIERLVQKDGEWVCKKGIKAGTRKGERWEEKDKKGDVDPGNS